MESRLESGTKIGNVRSEDEKEQSQREELYDQFDVPKRGRIAITYLLPLLERAIQTEQRYDVEQRSKILAEISLYQAYEKAPKFKILGWATLLLGVFDLLHSLNPAIYGIVFIALATLNGFVSSLRSPLMMAAELERKLDEDGMPADYRAKALSSVNTNVTLVLFVFAVGVQLIVTSSIVETELLRQNVADGALTPAISASVLFVIPLLVDEIF